MQNPRILFAAALATAASALALPTTAHALPGSGHPTVTLGFEGGYGTAPPDFNVNPYDGAIGGRAGISLYDIYVGASFHYHFGATSSFASATANVYTAGGELGYDIIPTAPIVIRPYVALGSHTARLSSTIGALESSRFFAAPGILVLLKPIGPLTVGVDMRYVLPVRNNSDRQDYFSFGIFGTAGVAF